MASAMVDMSSDAVLGDRDSKVTAPLRGGAGERYAIYFAPPQGSQLERFGAAWLGRAADGTPVRRLTLPGIGGEERGRVLADPHRYGFHATLKAPIRLRKGKTARAFLAAAEAFADRQAPFMIPALRVTPVGGFLALCPLDPLPALDHLAAKAVEALDGFRAPPTAAETARRHSVPLNEAQKLLLQRWGYPYVFDEFRFHMTLTGQLVPERMMAWWRAAEAAGQRALSGAVPVREICVFREAAPERPFTLIARFPFRS